MAGRAQGRLVHASVSLDQADEAGVDMRGWEHRRQERQTGAPPGAVSSVVQKWLNAESSTTSSTAGIASRRRRNWNETDIQEPIRSRAQRWNEAEQTPVLLRPRARRSRSTHEHDNTDFRSQALAHFRQQRQPEVQMILNPKPEPEDEVIPQPVLEPEMNDRERRRAERLKKWRGEGEVDKASALKEKEYIEKRRREEEKINEEARKYAAEKVRAAKEKFERETQNQTSDKLKGPPEKLGFLNSNQSNFNKFRLAAEGRCDMNGSDHGKDEKETRQRVSRLNTDRLNIYQDTEKLEGEEKTSSLFERDKSLGQERLKQKRFEQEEKERLEQERQQQEHLEHLRIEEGQRLEQERLEHLRLEEEESLEQEHLEQQHLEHLRLEEEERLQQEHLEQQHLQHLRLEEEERLEQEHLEQEGLQHLRLEEEERLEQELLQEKRMEQEQLMQKRQRKRSADEDRQRSAGRTRSQWNDRQGQSKIEDSDINTGFISSNKAVSINSKVGDRKAKFESPNTQEDKIVQKPERRIYVYGAPNLKSLQEKFSKSQADDSLTARANPVRSVSKTNEIHGERKPCYDENSNKVGTRWKLDNGEATNQASELIKNTSTSSSSSSSSRFGKTETPSAVATKVSTFSTTVTSREDSSKPWAVPLAGRTKDKKTVFESDQRTSETSRQKPIELRLNSANTVMQKWKAREEKSGMVAGSTPHPLSSRQRSQSGCTDGDNAPSERRLSSSSSISSSSSSTWRDREALRYKEEEEKEEQERLERERKKEEAARRKEEEERKKKGKRKGLGGLSPEKKKLLKKLIMQKAAEDLRNEAIKKAEEREKYINERVEAINTEGLRQALAGGQNMPKAELNKLVKDLHQKVANLEEEVYDWEVKIRKQDYEINELTLKVNDMKGKFVKPVLRKVSKTEAKLAKIEKKEAKDFRTNLKSTGHNKYALEEEKESGGPAWRDNLKTEGEEKAEEAS
ncbi:trichohyalin-like isoform X12 [Liolophura sinensis]